MNHVWKSSPLVYFTRGRHWPFPFNDVYSEQIAKWEHCCEEEDRDAEYLHAKCFFTEDIYDASSTIFGDDITKRTVTKTLQEVITKVGTVRVTRLSWAIFFGRLGAEVEGPLLEDGHPLTERSSLGATAGSGSPIIDRH